MFSFKTFIAEATIVDDVSGHNPVVIAPGRFNPPHRGHRAMIEKLIKLGIELHAEPIVLIIDSGKYGPKNPLPGSVREKYLKKMFPNVRYIVAKNPYEAVAQLANPEEENVPKFVPVGGVTGSDRAKSYKDMIGRMFGPKAEEKYKAVILHRDPDAEDDVAGVSATKVREAALKGDIGKFRAMTGLKGKDADELMTLVQKGMEAE